MLTVRELLRDLPIGLSGGEGGLDAPVRWVHISELVDPTPWLSGGEVLLTTGLQLTTAKQQREFVARLADHGLAALGLGIGFAHDTVPKALASAARERDFPLFEVPYELPFIAVTEKAFTRLVNEQYAVLQRAIAAHERLERIVLAERGLEAVVAALATLVGGSALVFDARGELVARKAFRRALDDDTLAGLRDELRVRGRGGGRGFVPAQAGLEGALALPVAATGTPGERATSPQAWLVAAKDSGDLSEFDRLTLRQAVTIIQLELLRGRVAEDTERRLAGDVLAELLAGDLAGADLARRLEPFGLPEEVAALVVAAPSPPPRANGHAAPAAGELALAAALREEAAGGLVAASAGHVVLLVPGVPDEELFALAQRVHDRLAAELGAAPGIGAGRAVPAAEARRAYHEARCALEARQLGTAPEGNGNGRHPTWTGVATYHDLGSFQLLLSLQDDHALRLFCDSILGPIEGGEGHYGGELVRSLEAFIECNGQWERAARRLYCHRHTLRYRIRKVEELTGRDLGLARDRIEFWLALRGRELVA